MCVCMSVIKNAFINSSGFLQGGEVYARGVKPVGKEIPDSFFPVHWDTITTHVKYACTNPMN